MSLYNIYISNKSGYTKACQTSCRLVRCEVMNTILDLDYSFLPLGVLHLGFPCPPRVLHLGFQATGGLHLGFPCPPRMLHLGFQDTGGLHFGIPCPPRVLHLGFQATGGLHLGFSCPFGVLHLGFSCPLGVLHLGFSSPYRGTSLDSWFHLVSSLTRFCTQSAATIFDS